MTKNDFDAGEFRGEPRKIGNEATLNFEAVRYQTLNWSFILCAKYWT